MTKIETTATVGDDHSLTLQLPPEISPGEHRIVVYIDGAPTPDEDTVEPPLKRVGNVLVHTGKPLGPIENIVDEVRREREAQLLQGFEKTSMKVEIRARTHSALLDLIAISTERTGERDDQNRDNRHDWR